MCEYCANYKKPNKELVFGNIFICSAATYTRVGYATLVHSCEDWIG